MARNRFFFYCFVFSLTIAKAFAAGGTDTLLNTLNDVIQKEKRYTDEKLRRIDKYHEALKNIPKLDDERRYVVLQKLSEEYQSFVYDSAFTYLHKMQEVSYRLKDPVKIAWCKLQFGFIFLSSGMFKETLDSLKSMKVLGLPDSIKINYFYVLARTYYDLGDFDREIYFTPYYGQLGNAYVDSALSITTKDSYISIYLSGLKNLKNENTKEALSDLNRLLDDFKLTPHQLAVTASTLSYYYISRNKPDQAINLLARAAIADIKSATKETAAMSSLAELLYHDGDIKNAYIFIQQAMNDAIFYGARQRKIQVSSILPLIASAQLSSVDELRKKWFMYSTALSILALLVLTFATIIFFQLRKLKVTQKALVEANTIKEEYIGYYFNINSEYLDKIETFKKAVEMKLITKKIEDIRFIVNNINLKREREELSGSFDKVFLKLFPDFVKVFNSYFKEEDQIVLKEGQLLNTELRIFALIRMGISDPEKIARILDYSINTIYNYKARIKSKSIIPNEDFEREIMKISTI